MSWKEEVEGRDERLRQAQALGGPEAVEAQHARGRLTIRERIAGVLDPGSFQEQGPLAGHTERDADGRLQFTPANYVLGFGKIDGRRVVVCGEDFTQKGGSPSRAGLRKSVLSEELALRSRVPLLRFLEGGGGSVPRSTPGKAAPAGGAGESINAPPRFLSIVRILGQVPVVSAAVGAVAGFPAARLAASHLSIMTRRTSQVLIGGPALVERALGVSLTKEELGGAPVHAKSGVVDNVAEDEGEVFALMRRFLSYLPSHVHERAPRTDSQDTPDRPAPELLDIIPRERRKSYKMRRIVEAIVDCESFFELTPLYGRTQITGLARLDGQPVGVLANDPNFYAGSMTADGAQKLRRFVDLCDTFHLPIVSLVDEPGFMIGPEAERAGTMRHGVAALAAVMESTVPWLSILVRKVYGVAGAAHFGTEGTVIAWPSAESGALPIEGGVAVAFRREIESAPDPEARRRELEDRIYAARDPFARAEGFGVRDLIDPRHTRAWACNWIEWIQPQLELHTGPRSYSLRP